MANFDFTVDTSPMAQEISGISAHVGLTTAAVVGMEAAVIAAEQQAADEVCRNVNQGFHRLIRSQISQKKILAQAAAGAKLLELRRFALSLRKIREQLGSDFQRITSRYARLFRSLDDALASRVCAVDQEAFLLAERQLSSLSQRVSTVGTPMVVHGAEVQSLGAQLLVSRVRRNTLGLISGVQAYVQKGSALKRSLNEVVCEQASANLNWIYLPALVVEKEDVLMAGSRINTVQVCEACPSRAQETILRRVDEAHADLKWVKAGAKEQEEVRQRVLRTVSRSGLDERRQRLISGLVEKACWNVVKESA